VGPTGEVDLVLSFSRYDGPTAKWAGPPPNLGNGTYTVTAGSGSGIENTVTAELNCFTVTETPTPEVTETATPEVTPELTETSTPEVTPELTETATSTPEITPELTETSTPEVTVTPDPTQEVTPEQTETATATPDPTDDPTPEVTDQPTDQPTDDPNHGTQVPPPADPSWGCKFSSIAQYWYFVPVGESWAWGGIPYQLSTLPTEIWIGGSGHHPVTDFEVFVYGGSGDIHDPASYTYLATFSFVADRDCARVDLQQPAPTPRPIPPSGSNELPEGQSSGNPLPVVGFAVLVGCGTVWFYRRRARRVQG